MTQMNLSAAMMASDWLVEPRSFSKLLNECDAISAGLSADKPTYHNNMVIDGDTATIFVSGYLMESVPDWMRRYGVPATGYDSLFTELTMAANDPDVNQVTMVFNTPGGQVSGQSRVAEAIAELNEYKTVTAVVNGMCCSGGYWLASQCSSIIAEENSLIGSIGVFSVYTDMSQMADDMGIKVNVIASGKYKGAGVPGAPITDEQIEDVRRNVNTLADNFILAVARGRDRPKSEIMNLADGRCWIGQEAVSVGLVDEIRKASVIRQTPTETGAEPMESIESKNEQEEVQTESVETQEAEPVADTQDGETESRLAEMQSTIDTMASTINAMTAKIEKMVAGAEPVENNTDSKETGDFMTVAKEMAKEKGISMTDAMRQVAKESPELHAAFLGGNK